MYEYFNDDITFCDNRRCDYERCERHPKRIQCPFRAHSFALLEGTEYCPKKERKKERVILMTQIITKDKVVKCVTTVPYPPEVIKQMKKAGYKIKEQ